MATIKDVAKYANVSFATVSRVLNNKGAISEKTKQAVMMAIKELGYVPNNAARSLVMKKTNVIGILINNLNDPFYYDLIAGFQSASLSTSFNIVFCNTSDNSVEQKMKYVQYLANGVTDGVVLYGSHRSNEGVAKYLYEKSFPFIVIENDIKEFPCSQLLIDNFNGAVHAIQYLADLGHEKIALICGDLNVKASVDRLNGYIHAMQQQGLSIGESHIQHMHGNYKEGYRCMLNLLSSEDKVTAVFCTDDATACYAINAAIDQGVRVPEDISVMGFDDQRILPTRYNGPDVTTVKQHFFQIGADAITLLADTVTNDRKEIIRNIYETEIVEKKSTIRCKGSTPK